MKTSIKSALLGTLAPLSFLILTQSLQAQDTKPLVSTVEPNTPLGIIPDGIAGPFSYRLDGLDIEYKYSSGNHYRLSFYDDRVTIAQLTPEANTTTLPYLARRLHRGIYLVHWLEPGRESHVSLVLDLKSRTVAAAGLMPGEWELFDAGDILNIIER